MAKLSAFTVNSGAIEAGEWIQPGEEYDDLKLKVRGFTDAYYDAQAQKLRRAALGFGGDVSKVPNAVQRDIRVECLIAHVVLDVANLSDDSGAAVDIGKFRDVLRQPGHGDLVVAVMRAAAMVGRGNAADVEHAVGN